MKEKDKLRIQLGLVVVLALLALSLLLSQTASPDAPPIFALKRIQEKAFLSLKSNPEDRVNFMRNILDTRLEELKSQVNRESYGYILPSALRYSSLTGEITELIVANNLKDQAQSVSKQLNNHLKTLEEIYVIYPKNTENTEYKYIEDDINYLKIYLDKLNSLN